jgi:hypothetical protein
MTGVVKQCLTLTVLVYFSSTCFHAQHEFYFTGKVKTSSVAEIPTVAANNRKHLRITINIQMHSEPFMLACQSILAANFLFLRKFHSFLRKFRTDKQSMLLSVFKHFRRFCWEGGTDYRVMCCIALQKKKGGGPLFSPCTSVGLSFSTRSFC